MSAPKIPVSKKDPSRVTYRATSDLYLRAVGYLPFDVARPLRLFACATTLQTQPGVQRDLPAGEASDVVIEDVCDVGHNG